MSFTIRTVGADETAKAAAALRELWPKYSEAEIVTQVDELLRPNGYNLIGLWTDDSPNAVCALGYRIQYSLWLGKSLYVVDIATLPEWRGNGFGPALMEWVEAEARRLDCAAVHLDSGVGADRAAAHRMYMQRHYQIVCHHFLRRLS